MTSARWKPAGAGLRRPSSSRPRRRVPAEEQITQTTHAFGGRAHGKPRGGRAGSKRDRPSKLGQFHLACKNPQALFSPQKWEGHDLLLSPSISHPPFSTEHLRRLDVHGKSIALAIDSPSLYRFDTPVRQNSGSSDMLTLFLWPDFVFAQASLQPAVLYVLSVLIALLSADRHRLG